MSRQDTIGFRQANAAASGEPAAARDVPMAPRSIDETGRGVVAGGPGGRRGPERGPAPSRGERALGPRRERYLVAPQPQAMLPPGYPAVDAQGILALLESDPAVTVSRVIRSYDPAGAGPFPAAPTGYRFPDVVVVEMEADRAAMLAATSQVHVEPDLPLQYAEPAAAGADIVDPGLTARGEESQVTIVVRGTDGTPLERADVYLMCATLPVHGVTGADGHVGLTVPVGSLSSAHGICVVPRLDYWSIWLGNPDLTFDTPNLISCPPLADSFPGFPDKELDSWARRAMRFDALPPTFRGHGVKIAIIDSGVAMEHPDLAGRITGGRDIYGRSEDGWRVDTAGYGSHCAGIIVGNDNGAGIVGLVPEAELHTCKIFPDGRASDLIEALDYCLAATIDVANLALGSAQYSELVTRKIEQARQSGMACIAPAGNSAGPVAFPAWLPSVLAVAAVGMVGAFPPETYHATQMFGLPTPEGYFSAKFTCHGPQVDVCAPGVAIVSSVPPRNYAAFDGTNIASPHVTALAAMLLAHHPEFADRLPFRTAARVDRLFEIIRGSCRSLALGDTGRSGAGMPDALHAFGLGLPAASMMVATMPSAGLGPPWGGTGEAPEPSPPAGPTPADPLEPLRTALRAAGLFVGP
jgi:subtilisin